jgi:hypothetical protein
VTRCGGAAQAAGFAALCRVVGGGWLESDFGWFGTLPSTEKGFGAHGTSAPSIFRILKILKSHIFMSSKIMRLNI